MGRTSIVVRKLLGACIAVQVLLFCTAVRADEVSDYVSVHCDSEHQTATIGLGQTDDDEELTQSHNVQDFAPYKVSPPDFVLKDDGDEGRCVWPDGTQVLVRFGVDWDSHGNQYTAWSAWVDHAKWVNRSVPIGFPKDPNAEIIRVVISPAGMEACTVDPRRRWANPKESCTQTDKGKLPTEPDLGEFPAPGKERPKSFTPLVRHSTNDKLCRAMIKPSREASAETENIFWLRYLRENLWMRGLMLSLPDGATLTSEMEMERTGQPSKTGVADDHENQFATRLEQARASIRNPPSRDDIDNSGEMKWVISRHPNDPPLYADFYYVYSDAGMKQLEASELTWNDLYQNAESSYPWSWLKCTVGQPSPDKEYAGAKGVCSLDDPLPWSVNDQDGKEIRFRSRYLRILPFQFEKVVYMLLTTADQDSNHIAFLVEPRPDGKAENVCTIESVRPYL